MPGSPCFCEADTDAVVLAKMCDITSLSLMFAKRKIEQKLIQSEHF